VCPECGVDDLPDAEALASLGLDAIPAGARPRRGVGCVHCEETGFRGRRGVFEVVEVDAGLRRLMLDGADEQQLLAAAMERGTTRLRDDALEAASRGETTYFEAMRMTVQRDVES
jgi:type II secretory ATPase GspE/PulE/Tfp pilus assembly ATPase PilB-like protein